MFKELSNDKQNEILFMHNNILEECKLFLQTKELKYKNRIEAANAVAAYFRKINPKNEEDYNHFYETCDDYLYENLYCNMENSCKQRTKKIFDILEKNNGKKILEIGAGIGTYSLALEKAGIESLHILKSNDLAFRFLKFRMILHNSNIKIIEDLEEDCDCIFFLDVIEHTVDPFAFLEKITAKTNSIIFTHGFKIHTEKMGGYPQHFDFNINKIQKHLEKLGFEKQKVNVIFPPHYYKRKNETN